MRAQQNTLAVTLDVQSLKITTFRRRAHHTLGGLNAEHRMLCNLARDLKRAGLDLSGRHTFLDDAQVADLPENRDYPSKVWGLVMSIPDQATADAVLAKAKRLGYDYLTLQDTDTNATWHELLPAQWLWDVLAK